MTVTPSKEKILHETKISINKRLSPLLFLFLAFLSGCLFTGLLIYRQRFAGIGELAQRYDNEYRGATETVRRLEDELERERGINRQLRENNTRARSIAEGLTGTAERNVRNLQDAIVIISEIRTKLKVLADFYTDSDSANGSR